MPFSCSISSLLPSSSLQSVMVPHTCIMHIPALLAMEGNTLWCMTCTERIEDLGAGLAAHFQLDGYPAFVACFLSLILASFSPTVYYWQDFSSVCLLNASPLVCPWRVILWFILIHPWIHIFGFGTNEPTFLPPHTSFYMASLPFIPLLHLPSPTRLCLAPLLT